MSVFSIFALFPAQPSHAQELSKRLILKDGTYQLCTKWEVHGDRVRYLSAERNDWEELPNDLVDWDATNKFANDRAAGKPDPEAAKVDKELEAEEAEEQARTPIVAPGLRLPSDGNVLLLDSFKNEPELIELQQNAGEINANRTQNILRATVMPMGGAKETIELAQSHATVQSHVGLPAIYVKVDSEQNATMPAPMPVPMARSGRGLPGSSGSTPPSGQNMPQQPQQTQQPEQAWDRFHIARAEIKKDKRIVGDIKVNPLGKTSQQQNLILTTSQRLTGDWVKITPMEPLAPGEYAVVELLGQQGMNTFVWDFGVNPSAPVNANAIKPDPKAAAKTP
ncbi:MAG TPA: hypothetical protein VF753_22380 [Terriglobales bacterium]